jgi:hypothetical protein
MNMFAGEVGRMRREQVELRTLVSSTRQYAYNGSWLYVLAEAGILENYCAKKLRLRAVELRFCPWLILFKY